MHNNTESPALDVVGEQMYAVINDLYPVCRSITGNGVRSTLERIRQEIPLTIHEVPSGTPVFDWVVPLEWNIKDAYVITPTGEKIAEFKKNNLHVLNYSIPVQKKVTLDKFSSISLRCRHTRTGSLTARLITKRTGVFVLHIINSRHCPMVSMRF